MSGRRIDTVTITVGHGIIELPWASREALLDGLREAVPMQPVVAAFEAVGTSAPVSLTREQQGELLGAIRLWSLLAGGLDGLPAGMVELRDALADELFPPPDEVRRFPYTKVPEYIEDCRVVYFVPYAEPTSNGEGEPGSHAHALVESPRPTGTYAKRNMIDGRPPSDLFGIDLDAAGQALWESDYLHLTEDDFIASFERWGKGLRLLRPGDEIEAADDPHDARAEG